MIYNHLYIFSARFQERGKRKSRLNGELECTIYSVMIRNLTGSQTLIFNLTISEIWRIIAAANVIK